MNERKAVVLKDIRVRENVLMRNVYLWMVAGLAITAGVSYATAHSVTLLRFLFGNPLTSIVIFVAQIVLVMALSSRVERLSTGAATAIFIAYSALTGLTLSSVFIVYAGAVIVQAFIAAAAVFAAGAVYGAVTKKDLRGIGGYLTMGLFGLLIAMLLNLIFRSSMFDLVVSVIGVVLFTGLTAWDSQRIADMNSRFGSDMTSDELTKIGILGALDLYLDFINIFLYLVRIFGRSDN